MSEVSKIAPTFFMMSEARWTAVENVAFYSKRSIVIKFQVMINLSQTSCFQCINGLSHMEKVCRTGKVSERLGLLNRKFLRRLAMLYGVADEPLNLITTPLMSMQVRFAPIFKNLTQNHAWYLFENVTQNHALY